MLCEQQAQVLQTQIAFAQVRVLSSNERVEAWSSTKVWDAALLNVKIVVSTPQVLLDALSHAFVRIDGLSLLVIDEGEP
jgi:ERCC4-related helicase